MSVESAELDGSEVVSAFVRTYQGRFVYGETPETDSYRDAGPYIKYELDKTSVRIRPLNDYKPNSVVLFANFRFKEYLKELPENVVMVDDLPAEFEGLKTDYWIGVNGKMI